MPEQWTSNDNYLINLPIDVVRSDPNNMTLLEAANTIGTSVKDNVEEPTPRCGYFKIGNIVFIYGMTSMTGSNVINKIVSIDFPIEVDEVLSVSLTPILKNVSSGSVGGETIAEICKLTNSSMNVYLDGGSGWSSGPGDSAVSYLVIGIKR